MLMPGTRTTASSLSVTSVPPPDVPVAVPMFVRLPVTWTVAEQAIDSPAVSVDFGQVATKSSPVLAGVPLSSETTMPVSVTGPVLVTV